jgi:hypothetical protein
LTHSSCFTNPIRLIGFCFSSAHSAASLLSKSKYMKLNDYAKLCHEANQKWWYHIDTGEKLERNKGELLMLMVSELAECMEGERKNLMDDKLPHRKMAEVEIVDFLIRAFDFCAGFGLQVEEPGFETSAQDSLNSIAYALHFAWIGESEKINRGQYLMAITARLGEAFRSIGDSFELGLNVSVAIHNALIYAHGRDFDIDGAFKDKQAYNATREDHKHEARRLANGKKF